MSDPKVWIGSLNEYNSGRLTGSWFDAELAPTTAEDWVTEMAQLGTPGLDAQENEEIWVFDHEGFDGLLDGECSPYQAQRVAEGIAAIRESGVDPKTVAAWASEKGETFTEWDRPTREAFDDSFRGEYDTWRDFVYEEAENYIPADAAEMLTRYFDYDAYGDDLAVEFTTVTTPDYKIWVFQA